MELSTNLIGKPLYTASIRQYAQEKVLLPNGRIGYQNSYRGYISQYTVYGMFRMDPNIVYRFVQNNDSVHLYLNFDSILIIGNGLHTFLVGIDKDGAMYAPEETLAGEPKKFFWTEEEAKADQEMVCERARNTYKNVREVVYQ